MVKYTLDNFYWSKEWRALLAILKDERADPQTGVIYCAHCGLPINGKYQCTGHHTVPLTEENVNDPEISLNPELVELIHTSCHNKEHTRFARNMLNVKTGKKVFLVYGPPLAGKTTSVRTTATESDLIVDIDALRSAMLGGDTYSRAKYGKTILFELRNLLLDRIRVRAGSWDTAYIIGGYPFASERKRICADYGAEEIFVEASEEECLKRLYEDAERARYLAEWERYIREWFEQYEPSPPCPHYEQSAPTLAPLP